MSTQTLRPNATAASSGWTASSGTLHGATSDDADGTYIVGNGSPGSSPCTLSLTGYTLGAGEAVKRIRSRVRGMTGGGASSGATCKHWPTVGSAGTTTESALGGSFAEYSGGWWQPSTSVSQSSIDDAAINLQDQGVEIAHLAEVYVDLDVWARTDAPTVAAPTGTVTDTDVPTIESYTAALNDGTPSLYSREVRVFRDAVYLAGGFDPETETDVEWEQTDTSLVSVSADSGTPDEVTVGEPLANSDTYRAYVRYGKNDVAGQTLWSTWGYAEFTLNLTLPTAPTVDVTVDEPNGRQTVEVTTAAATHDTVESLRLERSDDGGTTWATVRDGYLTDVAASTVYTFHDYDAPRATSLQYRARVVEGITASGTTLTSDWTTSSPVAHPNDGTTWLYDVAVWDHVGAYRILRGVARQPSEQQGVFRPLGRSTAVVVTAGRTADTIRLQMWASDRNADVDDVKTLAAGTGKLLAKWSDGTQEYLRVTSRTVDVADIGGERRRTWDMQAVQVASGITSDG